LILVLPMAVGRVVQVSLQQQASNFLSQFGYCYEGFTRPQPKPCNLFINK
jgi:hypothetical protein